MTTPESSKSAPDDNIPSDDTTEQELSLEDLDDVTGGAVIVHERKNEQNDK
jgi:Cu/Zn superoxide dismutase